MKDNEGEELYYKGNRARDAGDYDAAIDFYTKAIECDHNDWYYGCRGEVKNRKRPI